MYFKKTRLIRYNLFPPIRHPQPVLDRGDFGEDRRAARVSKSDILCGKGESERLADYERGWGSWMASHPLKVGSTLCVGLQTWLMILWRYRCLPQHT